MKGFVEVISPGLYSTIQDSGRNGFRKYGVPPSGPMDKQSADMANHLLNNPMDAALMEITMHGPTLLFSVATQITIAGADISPKLNESEISRNKVVHIKPGDILTFGLLRFGARCYLAVRDGFQTANVLNSKSYFVPVTMHSLIKKGDKLPVNSHPSTDNSFSIVKNDDGHFKSINLSCTKGPEFDLLENQTESIFGITFSVSKDNNRMGYRLEGTPISYPENFNMLTSAVLPGTVQLTPAGQLIALMQDCQTTGGYPRILQLTRFGINTLAQKKAGDVVSFKEISTLH